jgi:hypothetical protein
VGDKAGHPRAHRRQPDDGREDKLFLAELIDNMRETMLASGAATALGLDAPTWSVPLATPRASSTKPASIRCTGGDPGKGALFTVGHFLPWSSKRCWSPPSRALA